MTINRGIYADTKQMLMVLRQSPRGDYISPGAGLPGINVDDADDSCSPRLNNDTSCLIELVGKYVLVIC
jgi:hypothetical protein